MVPVSGFTLLELVVVLAVLGLATAIAAPAAMRGIDTWRRQSTVDALADAVRGLPARARMEGAVIRIDADTLASPGSPLPVAEGWELSAPSPWSVGHNGACEGGTLLLVGDGRRVLLEVGAPFCDVSIEPR